VILRNTCDSTGLNDDEKNTLYSMLDAFVGKRKLKDALSNVLQDVK